MIERERRLGLEHPVMQQMFIERAGLAQAALIGQEREAEKRGLLDEAVGAAIETAADFRAVPALRAGA